VCYIFAVTVLGATLTHDANLYHLCMLAYMEDSVDFRGRQMAFVQIHRDYTV